MSPSEKLLSDYKRAEKRLGDKWKAWDFVNYEKKYREEIMTNPEALKKIEKIKERADKKDIYLVCYEKDPPCHRFVLLDIIRKFSKQSQIK